MPMTEFDAGSGARVLSDPAATATPPAAATPSFGVIDLDLIADSPTNPRTSHNRGKLQQLLQDANACARIRELLATDTPEAHTELAEILGTKKLAEFVHSIAAQGVNTPILLRPLPASRLADTAIVGAGRRRPEYELVAGERRTYGSRLAATKTIPAMIKAMTDQQVLEFQLVENLQRDDLHPLEEAEGYQRLVDSTGIRKEDIAGKIGKSRSYVYERLKLAELCTEVRDAFRAGRIDLSHATRISKIPDDKLQVKAFKQATEFYYAGNLMPVREFDQWLQQNVMLRLDRAEFDIKADKLVPKCGSCSTCPKRTGANPDLFAEVKGADLCTDPKCFDAKKEAHFAAIAKAAADKGQTVIFGKEAKELMPNAYSAPKGYMRLDNQEYVDGFGYTSVRKAIGKENLPTAVLFQNPHTKQLEEVIPEAAAKKLLKAAVATKEDKQKAATGKKPEPTYEELWQGETMRQVFARCVAGAMPSMTATFGRWLLVDLMNRFDVHQWGDMLCELFCIENAKVAKHHAIETFLQECPLEMIGPAMTVMAALVELDYDPYGKPPLLHHLAEVAGVDVEGIQREARAAAPAEKSPKGGKGKAATAPAATPAFMAPKQPSAELAALIGDKPVTSTAAVTALWNYIKKNKLQDPDNQRMVIADDKLEAMIGKPQVSMFELAGLLGQHLHVLPPPGATVEAAPQVQLPRDKGAGAAGAKKPGAAKPRKLSPQEAQLGIADAMQSVEPTSGGRPAVGSRVKFLQDVRYLGKLQKTRDKEGEVTALVGDRAVTVRLDKHKPSEIDADYTEVSPIDTAPAFVVGDRVRIIKYADTPKKMVGKLGTLETIDTQATDGHAYEIRLDSDSSTTWLLKSGEFERATEA